MFLPHEKFFLEELIDESEQPAPRLVPLVERKFELSVIVERPGSSHDLAGSGVKDMISCAEFTEALFLRRQPLSVK